MDGRIFQDYSGRSFGDASDAYELNPYSEDISTPESPDQPAESTQPRYTLTESYDPAPPSSYPLTEPYAPPRVAAGPRDWTPGPFPSPNGRLKRYPTRKVKLVEGAVLTIDYPVPRAILNSNQTRYISDIRDGEFTKMTYTAATCDPNEFTLKNGYDLRARKYNRHTELFVCVTYYNEDKVLFTRSYHSIMQNLRDIISTRRSTFWNKGGPAWQKVVLCLVMDGVDACDKGVLDTLATVGVYQHGVMKRDVVGRETQAHIFEYTTQLSVTDDQRLIQPTGDNDKNGLPPVQVILCIKSKNSGKINSNRWLLNAFGRILNPEVVVHIDAGTRIDQNSLLKLWGAFYNDKNLGGACGVIRPYLGPRGIMLLNPLVACQNFEYKVACQLERAIESTTGYLSVLPGAFSAYRFRAIMGRPLEEYFHGDSTLIPLLGKKHAIGSLWRMNRYLADDRILTFELTTKEGCKWHTRIVPSASGETDIPVSTVDFINQRRRWLNGSLSATIYSLRMSYRLFQTGHTIRIAALLFQMLYNLLSFLLAWFSLAGYLLTTFIVNDITGDPPKDSQLPGFPFGAGTRIVNSIIQILYLTTVIFLFIIALGGQPKSHRLQYTISFSIFSLVQLYLIINLIYLTKRLIDYKTDPDGASSYGYISEYYADVGSLTVLVTAISVFGVYIVAGIVCLDPWHLLHSWAPYMFISSSYTNILKTYAFSNIHDSSWGLKSGKKELIQPPPPPPNPNSNAEEIIDDIQQDDIDAIFAATVKRALMPHTEEREAPVPDKEDRNGTFLRLRTTLIAVYLFSNFMVCIIVMNDSFQTLWWMGDSYWHKIWFFRLWMWGNSVLLVAQLGGCLVQRVVGGVRRLFYRY